jgi:CheY-like chemotaxis protein/two-component sensor histidine kinase
VLNIVSSDLRAPLNSIRRRAEALAAELTTLGRADQQHHAQTIAQESSALAQLIDNLLDAQRIEAGRARWQMQSRDLAITIEASIGTFETLAQHRGIEFQVECPRSLPPIVADSDRIMQVVSNLLSNAMKRAASGGRVHLMIQAVGGELLIRVTDNGPGIPRDCWDQVFAYFGHEPAGDDSDRSAEGLGLYIVRRIVEGYGGRVWVDSAPDGESEFYASLPLERIDLSEPSASAHPPTRAIVVVCDADPELAARIARALDREEFDVRVAHSGARLLEHVATGDVDVVVTDVLLPDVAAASLLAALNDGPARSFGLIIHSYADEGAGLTSPHADAFVPRPATGAELAQAVKNVLRDRCGSPAQPLVDAVP